MGNFSSLGIKKHESPQVACISCLSSPRLGADSLHPEVSDFLELGGESRDDKGLDALGRGLDALDRGLDALGDTSDSSFIYTFLPESER
jgi:hypothetical protein